MRKNTRVKIGMLLMMVAVIYIPTIGVYANVGSREAELSRNGAVHQERYDEILNNMGDYAYVENFKLTRYVPRDASEKGWESTTKSITGKSIKSVHWYQEGGSWVFSSASAERFELAKEKFSGNSFTENTHLYGGDERKVIWQMKFSESVSTEDRKAILPTCRAYVQYSGDPFTGAHGFVDWGSVAADVAHNNVFKKDAELFIEGYGKGDVHDVGGGVRGRHLDLFMDNCKYALSDGKTNNALVIFKKSQSSIKDGKPVTKEILDKVMNGKKWGDGGTSGGITGSGTSTSGVGGVRDKFNPFNKNVRGGSSAGVDSGEVALPGELSYTISSYTSNLYNFMRIVMFVMCAGLILFVGLQVSSLALRVRTSGIVGEEKAIKLDTFLFGEGKSEDRMKIIFSNFIILAVMSVLVLGNYYIPIQGKLYMGIEYIVALLF